MPRPAPAPERTGLPHAQRHSYLINTSNPLKTDLRAGGRICITVHNLPSIGGISRTCAAAVVLATMVAGTAAGAVAIHSTPAGTALARRALLVRADLGRGWVGTAAPKKVPDLTCPEFSPALAGVVQIGAAISPTFQKSPTGPFASQTAYAYASRMEAAAVWQAVARPRLLRCVSESLTRGSSDGVHFAVTGKRLLALPSLSVRAAGYRVTGTASVPSQTVNVYLDVLLLGGGDTVTELSISSFFQPASRALELRLARTVAGRIAAG